MVDDGVEFVVGLLVKDNVVELVCMGMLLVIVLVLNYLD